MTIKPIIGIAGNFEEDQLKLSAGYFRSIEAAGGIPVVIPPRTHFDASDVGQLIDSIDALVLSGGGDINPVLLGEDPVPALHSICQERDAWELELTRQACRRQLPVLGICRGIQVMAAALGGTLMQDMATSMPHTALLKHSQQAARGVATHFVQTEPNSLMRHLLGERLAVNSFHHQAVDEPGPQLCVTARSADGVIEAIESVEPDPRCRHMVGVQWHPECFLSEGDNRMKSLFDWLTEKAAQWHTARWAHQQMLTLDSHCDTPMHFDKDVDLCRGDEQLLVDFPKMREGHLDATIMVAYLPQGPVDSENEQLATEKALSLLNELEDRVRRADYAAIAHTPEELFENKMKGVLSVMRGIENGYALGLDLGNVERFARMGVVYITLCHNGDNRICDSARRSLSTHGGLSDFGREVVSEMNRCGLMVDLSHAAETSFYDALECSRTPIVCSHSSSRTLCNHPRNLTDDQLRALAQKGGVAQATFYHGFLRDDEETHGPANVFDAVKHILHMVDVAGVDHVGIGSDFDGDGGVRGLANASHMMALSYRLLEEGLTPTDLKKLWGGNFLRVMQQCQAISEIDHSAIHPC